MPWLKAQMYPLHSRMEAMEQLILSYTHRGSDGNNSCWTQGRKKKKKISGRDFHLPGLAVPKIQRQGMRILQESVPLCGQCRVSPSWRSGIPRAVLGQLHWGRIWEEAEQSLTARRGPDVFIIMEKIWWCLFAQRNTGGGNVLLSSDQG